MTGNEISRELEKIYEEMNRWSELNKDSSFEITDQEKERREAFLFLREALCRILQAKNEGNKKDEYYHSAFYYMIRFWQEQYRHENS